VATTNLQNRVRTLQLTLNHSCHGATIGHYQIRYRSDKLRNSWHLTTERHVQRTRCRWKRFVWRTVEDNVPAEATTGSTTLIYSMSAQPIPPVLQTPWPTSCKRDACA